MFRILQKRLHSTHMYFGTELADKTSDGEECVAGTSSDQWNDEPQRVHILIKDLFCVCVCLSKNYIVYFHLNCNNSDAL